MSEFGELTGKYFGGTELSAPSEFGDLRTKYKDKIKFTVGESLAEFGKSLLRIPEHLAGSVGKIYKFAAESSLTPEGVPDVTFLPGGTKNPLNWGGRLEELALEKLMPQWMKNKALAKQKIASQHGNTIAEFWDKAASTGFEAPSGKLLEARNRGWTEGSITRALTAVGDSGAPYVAAAAVTLLSRNPQLGLALLGTMSAADTYHELERAGVDKLVSKDIAILTGTFEAVTEIIPFNALMGKAGTGILKRFIKTGSLESLQEFIQNTGENYFKHFGYEYDPEDSSSIPNALKIEWGELMNGWFEAITAGFLMGGAAGMLGGTSAQDITPQPIAKDPTYMKGFVARLTSIRNNADNMLAGAGDKGRQSKIMLEELNKIKSHYQEIDKLIQENPEQYTELNKIKALLPSYESAINEFLQSPSKESFDSIKSLTDAITQQSTQYGIKLGEQGEELSAVKKSVNERIVSDAPNVGINKKVDPDIETGTFEDTFNKLNNDKGLETIPEQSEIEARKKQVLKERILEAEKRAEGKTGRAATAARKSAMVGKQIEHMYQLQNTYTPKDIDNLHTKINDSPKLNSFEKMSAADAIDKLFVGQPMAPHEIDLMHRVFGREFANKLETIREKLSPTKKAWYRYGAEILGIPQSLRAMQDMGVTLKQGIFYFSKHPFRALSLVKKTFLHSWSEAAANRMDMWIRDLPGAYIGEQNGLILRDWRRGGKAEGFYASKIMQKWKPKQTWLKILSMPWNTVVAAKDISERAFVLQSNAIRAILYGEMIEDWGTNVDPSNYKKMAQFVNHATGEASSPKVWNVSKERYEQKGIGGLIERNAELLAPAFWAPRLTVSRFQIISDLATSLVNMTTGKPNSIASKAIASEILRFGTKGLLFMTLCAMAGLDVDLDPRSTEFGKIKIGNTRYDIWGGYSQIGKFIAQVITGKRKTSITNKLRDVDRLETIKRFIRGKLAPVPGTVWDLAIQETFVGERLETPEQITAHILKLFVPLVDEDIADSIRYETALTIPNSVGAFFGAGVSTYPIRPSQESALIKDRRSQEVFHQGWDEIGPDAQKILKNLYPEIEVADAEARKERNDYDFVGARIEEQMKAGRKIQRSLPKPIQDNLDTLSVSVGGLSRQIGSNWYLNDDKYKQYQELVGTRLNVVLPKLMNTFQWKSASPELQREVVEEVLTEIKMGVREQIITEANRDDILRYKELKK